MAQEAVDRHLQHHHHGHRGPGHGAGHALGMEECVWHRGGGGYRGILCGTGGGCRWHKGGTCDTGVCACAIQVLHVAQHGCGFSLLCCYCCCCAAAVFCVLSLTFFPPVLFDMWRMMTFAVESCPGTSSQKGIKFIRIFTIVSAGAGRVGAARAVGLGCPGTSSQKGIKFIHIFRVWGLEAAGPRV